MNLLGRLTPEPSTHQQQRAMMWIWSRCGSSRGRGSSVLRQLLECQVVLAIILIALAQETSSSPLLLQVPLSQMLGLDEIQKVKAIEGLHIKEVA